MTYAGVLAGKPNARINQPIIEEVVEAARNLHRGTSAVLIDLYDIEGRLPAVACVAELQSGALRRPGSEPYTSMTIAWFQDEFAFPIAQTILGRIRELDWEVAAIDWCW